MLYQDKIIKDLQRDVKNLCNCDKFLIYNVPDAAFADTDAPTTAEAKIWGDANVTDGNRKTGVLLWYGGDVDEPHVLWIYTVEEDGTISLVLIYNNLVAPISAPAAVTDVNTATYDLLNNDYILHVTYTGTGPVTSLTLPTAQTTAGRTIIIKDAGGNATINNITIDTEGAQTIDGQANWVLGIDYESVTLYSDGTNWFTI